MPGRGSAPHPDAAGAIGTVRRIGSAVADGCLIAAEQLVDASGFNRPKVPFGNRRFATGTSPVRSSNHNSPVCRIAQLKRGCPARLGSFRARMLASTSKPATASHSLHCQHPPSARSSQEPAKKCGCILIGRIEAYSPCRSRKGFAISRIPYRAERRCSARIRG